MKLVSFTDLIPAEIDGLVDLERRVFERSVHYDMAPWTAPNFRAALPGKADLSWVARQAEATVGFLVASRRAPDEVRLHRLAVNPDFAGSGVASSLVARLIESTDSTISVACDPANERALALYNSFGFSGDHSVADGRVVLRRPGWAGVRIWYVYNTIGMASGHASHVPRLLDALAQDAPVAGVGYGTDELPAFRPTVRWLAAFLRFLRRARTEQVRVMFVRIHWPLAALLTVAGRVGGWRVVLWSSGGVGSLLDTPLTLRLRAQRAAFAWVLRSVVDGVATGPPAVADDYVRRYGLPMEKVLLVANDIDVSRWRAGIEPAHDVHRPPGTEAWFEAPFRVLYIHGLDRLRGADRLPGLASELAERLPGAAVLVVGCGPLSPMLDAAPELITVGPAPNASVALLLRHAHVLLVPSRQEGFPRVVLEALAAGCPPVCMDVGGSREVVGSDLADLLVGQSTQELTSLAIDWCTKFAEDGELHDALVARSREFDTPVVARRFAAALGTLSVAGVPAAHRLSWSGWHDVFARTP